MQPLKLASAAVLIGGLLGGAGCEAITDWFDDDGPSGPTGPTPTNSGSQRFGPYSDCRDWSLGADPNYVYENQYLAWCTNNDTQARAQALLAWQNVCTAGHYSAQGNNDTAEIYLNRAAVPCRTLTWYTSRQGDISCDCRNARWWPDVDGRSTD